MMKKVNIFKDPFNIFSVINLLVSIALFITLMIMVWPNTLDNVDYLLNIDVEFEKDITGWDVLTHSGAIIYFAMFLFMSIYSLYGILVLFIKNNERRVFKIMFRSIFYVSGMIALYNILAIVNFLFLPLSDFTSILSLIFMILAVEVAIGGRVASNFLVVNMKLKNRKHLAFTTAIAFIVLCIIAISFAKGEFFDEMIVFNTLLLVATLFAIPSIYFFKDPVVYYYKKEPKIRNNAKLFELMDLPKEIGELSEEQFRKDTKINRAHLENIEVIPKKCFSNCLYLKEVYLSKELKEIQDFAFFNCSNLNKIYYEGSVSDFRNITLGYEVFHKINTKIINCNDGMLVIEEILK